VCEVPWTEHFPFALQAFTNPSNLSAAASWLLNYLL
jgi:hypothetical protein